jgi:hypothetical protein
MLKQAMRLLVQLALQHHQQLLQLLVYLRLAQWVLLQQVAQAVQLLRGFKPQAM